MTGEKLKYEDLDKYVSKLDRRKEAGEMAIDLCKWMLQYKPSMVNRTYLWEQAKAVLDKLEGKR